VAVAPKDVGSLGSVMSSTSPAPAPAGHRYRSAWLRALVASVLIIAVAIMLPVQWWYSSLALRAVADGDEDVAKTILDQWIPLRLLFLGLIVAAFIGWAAWLSRVVDNLPALGVGYSRASPRMAFFESVVPVFNLFRLPARVREVTRLLHPQGGGDGLIAFAWLVLFGVWVIPILGVRLLTFWSIIEGDFASSYTAYVVLLGIALGGTAIGLLMVVAVIRRVESLAAARARGLVPAAAAPSTPAAPTAPVPAVATPTAPVSWPEPSPPAPPAAAMPAATMPATAMPATATAFEPPPAVPREPAAKFAGDRTVRFLAERAAVRPALRPAPPEDAALEPKSET
jgi:hypothetical protein